MGWFIDGQWYPDNMIEVGPDGQKRLKTGTKKASSTPPVPIKTKIAETASKSAGTSSEASESALPKTDAKEKNAKDSK